MRRRHHVDVAAHRQEPLALLAAGVGAVEDVVVIFGKVRRTLQRHRSADMVVRVLDVLAAVAEVAQQIEGRVVQLFGRDAQGFLAEFLAQRPLVEDKADVESAGKCRFDLVQFLRAEAVADQRGVVDPRRVPDGAMTDGVGDDLFDLGGGIPERLQRRRDRAVDDLEVTAPCQLLELHQGEVRFDACRVTIHHQADRAGGRDHGGLRVPVSVLLAKAQRLVPGFGGECHQALIRAVGPVERDRVDVHGLVALGLSVGGAPVVADHPQHVLGVALVAGERAKFARDLGRCGIGDTRHDRRQRTGHRAALVAVIAQPHVHQETADVGVAESQRAEVVGKLRDFL